MALNVVIPLLIPLEENIHNATRLVNAEGPVKFLEPQYCSLLPEDSAIQTSVAAVKAKHQKGWRITYTISEGNNNGIFSIDTNTGTIILNKHLDHEKQTQHQLTVTANGGGSKANCKVIVVVGDVNDNAPYFREPKPYVTIIEEDDRDLPLVVAKIEAKDVDWIDREGLLYTLTGDGVDGLTSDDAYFSVNARNGELTQLRPLDRDSPHGRSRWKLRVGVSDGQKRWRSAYTPAPPHSAYDRHSMQTKELNLEQNSPTNHYSNRRQGLQNIPDHYQKHQKMSSFGAATNSRSHSTRQENRVRRKHSHSRRFRNKYLRIISSLSRKRRKRNVPFIVDNKSSHRTSELYQNIIHETISYTTHLPFAQTNGQSYTSKYFISSRNNSENKVKKINGDINPDRRNQVGNVQHRTNVDLFDQDLDESSNNISNYSPSVTLKNTDDIDESQLDVKYYGSESELVPKNETGSTPKERNKRELSANYSGSNINNDEPSRSGSLAAMSSNGDQIKVPHKAIQLSRDACSRLETINGGTFGAMHRFLNSELENQMEIYQRLLWTSEVERGVWRRIHVVDAEVTIIVKDINDNSPKFPTPVMFGEVQENGPIDLSVTVVKATDDDDTTEGTNAQLSYSIEKNVLEENSGAPMFKVDETSGLLTTALCCLDRETTPEYQLQVVATDGGGLKGTGTVIVRLTDVNDNPPKLFRSEFNLEIPETWGRLPPDDVPLLDLTVTDEDTSNYFHYRIVEESGWGWDLFAVETKSSLDKANRTEGTNDNPHDELLFSESDFLNFNISAAGFSFTNFEDASSMWDEDEIFDEKHEKKPNSSQQPSAYGKLYAVRTLDYEDETHRRGFSFIVQVTDKGPGGWDDDRHVDQAWVRVNLTDLNDNPPQFVRHEAHVTVREDVVPGTLLVSLPANDKDEGGNQTVYYHLEDYWKHRLGVDSSGSIRVVTSLDREDEKVSSRGVAKIKVIAVDVGEPPLSSTATLTLTLTDVNDCSPDITVYPKYLHLEEEKDQVMIGTLSANDKDVWSLGHGPPFNFSLARINKPNILKLFTVKNFPAMDNGRGGAELWTTGPIDREDHKELIVEIKISDAGGVSAIHPLVVHIDDVNDNPMLPGNKIVHLWIPRGGNGEASLGRVYVDDPDDHDLSDKSFSWNTGTSHMLFSLDENTGMIYSSSHIREGRYELSVMVSDKVWQQTNVSANVTVLVKELDPSSLSHAIPLIVYPINAAQITKNWNPTIGGGILGQLLESIHQNLRDMVYAIEIISVSDNTQNYSNSQSTFEKKSSPNLKQPKNFEPLNQDILLKPSASIWIAAKTDENYFMDPVKLQGLIGLNLGMLEEATNFQIFLEEEIRLLPSPFSYSGENDSASRQESHPFRHSPEMKMEGFSSDISKTKLHREESSSATSLASTTVPLQVVDGNTSSLVTPRLSRSLSCSPVSKVHVDLTHAEPTSCTVNSCLNGGKCANFHRGTRCVCPGHTYGEDCKVLTRSFSGNGWAWLAPLPSCTPTNIELKFLTLKESGTLLYSGPLSSKSKHGINQSSNSIKSSIYNSRTSKSSLMHHSPGAISVQLNNGKLEVLLDIHGLEEPILAAVNSTNKLNDGKWHQVHLKISNTNLSVMIDRCSGSASRNKVKKLSDKTKMNKKLDRRNKKSKRQAVALDHCIAHSKWDSNVVPFWSHSTVLQLGGLAKTNNNKYKISEDMKTKAKRIISAGFKGCISELRINDGLVDLGKVSFSKDSSIGCSFQEKECKNGCGARGQCVGGLGEEAQCACIPGWTGSRCTQITPSVTLLRGSYAKLAISFAPNPVSTTVQLKLKTRRKTGLLLRLSAHHQIADFNLKFTSGNLCASIQGMAKHRKFGRFPINEVCVPGSVVSDGLWHTVRANRYGNQLLLQIDDGDRTLTRNETMLMLDDELPAAVSAPHRLVVDKQDGISIGGNPYFAGANVIKVEDDLYETCISDIRVDGKLLPLPPAVNGTKWGQVTTWQKISTDCTSESSCTKTSCASPLRCIDNWMSYTCGCPVGYRLGTTGCIPVDECLNAPCLHGSSCVSTSIKYNAKDLLIRYKRSDSPNNSSGNVVATFDSSVNNNPGDLESTSTADFDSWTLAFDGDLGFECRCPSWHSGRYCEWVEPRSLTDTNLVPLLILGVLMTAAILLLVLLLWMLLIMFRRQGKDRRKSSDRTKLKNRRGVDETHSDDDICGTPVTTVNIGDTSPFASSSTSLGMPPQLGSTNDIYLMEYSQMSVPSPRHHHITTELQEIKPKKSCLKHSRADDIRTMHSGIQSISGGVTSKNSAAKNISLQSRLKCPSDCLSSDKAAPDDLRAYAYEGEGSSGGSWTSSGSGLPSDSSMEVKCQLLPEFKQVMDLLQNLPDAQHCDKSRDIASTFHGNTLPNKSSASSSSIQSLRKSESISDQINERHKGTKMRYT